MCGWVPYSYVLLLDLVLWATMTEEMILWERDSGLFPTYITDDIKNMAYVENNDGSVCFKAMYSQDSVDQTLNFAGGALAQHVATTIIGEVDWQKAQDNAQKCKREGTTRRNCIMRIKKKMTAGRLVLDGGSQHLDQNVLDYVQRRRLELKTVELTKKLTNFYMLKASLSLVAASSPNHVYLISIGWENNAIASLRPTAL